MGIIEMWRTGRYLLLLFVLLALFFWKVVFTAQYSIAASWETANQGYAWHQFAASSIQKGILPIWDPYAESGRPHAGEMQPGLFYPLKLILYLWPLGSSGILSPRLFDHYYFLARFLGACFLFLLARELGMKNRLAALVAGFCFGAGGFVGNVGGLQLLDSAIWLPLVLLFLLRALRSGKSLLGLFYSCLSGACIGMTFLAGSIHLPIMDAIVVVSAAAVFAFRTFREQGPRAARLANLGWAAAVVLIAGAAAFNFAGIQLLPSIEYAPLSYRWGSSGETLQKMPYADLSGNQYVRPGSILALIFGGAVPAGLESGTSPYLGILPLLLAIIGVGVYRSHLWVKYLFGLGVLAFFYGMGPISILHGVLYLLPFLDMAREPDRFMYLTHFSVALLAGFGVEAVYEYGSRLQALLSRMVRAVGAVTCVLAAILLAATVFNLGKIEWYFVSLMVLVACWGVLSSLLRGNPTAASGVIVVAVIAADLYAFNWSSLDRVKLQAKGQDYQQQLLSAAPLARFFQSQDGLFRVHIVGEYPDFLNFGDMFAVQTTRGQSATSLLDYMPMTWSRAGLDVLNVRFVAAAGKDVSGKIVFESGKWKVYETDTALPRAWVVSRTAVEPSREKARYTIEDPGFKPRRVALVAEPLENTLSNREELQQQVSFTRYEPNLHEVDVQVDDTGFLVVSEPYYPGWCATVNGKPVKIYRADSVLRGVLVPPGRSRVVFEYRPTSLLIGTGLSVLAVAAILALGIILVCKPRALAENPAE